MLEKARGRGAFGRGHGRKIGASQKLGRTRHHADFALDERCYSVRHLAERDLDLPEVGLWPTGARYRRRKAPPAKERPEEVEGDVERGEVGLPGNESGAARGPQVIRALEVDLRDRLEIAAAALRVDVDSGSPKQSRQHQQIARDAVTSAGHANSERIDAASACGFPAFRARSGNLR